MEDGNQAGPGVREHTSKRIGSGNNPYFFEHDHGAGMMDLSAWNKLSVVRACSLDGSRSQQVQYSGMPLLL